MEKQLREKAASIATEVVQAIMRRSGYSPDLLFATVMRFSNIACMDDETYGQCQAHFASNPDIGVFIQADCELFCSYNSWRGTVELMVTEDQNPNVRKFRYQYDASGKLTVEPLKT